MFIFDSDCKAGVFNLIKNSKALIAKFINVSDLGTPRMISVRFIGINFFVD